MIEINIFSNCTNTCLREPTIYRTVDSLRKVFGLRPNRIYVDPNPNPHVAKEYTKQIREYLGIEPVMTTGLANGYWQSLTQSNTKFIMQLEHDWAFQNIQHGLDDIEDMMQRYGLWFLLFNKHPNDRSLNRTMYQSYFRATDGGFCLTDRISNNPHIIDRAHYLSRVASRINWNSPGAGQIEQKLQRSGLECAVYGEFGHPPTVVHLDGRKGGRK